MNRTQYLLNNMEIFKLVLFFGRGVGGLNVKILIMLQGEVKIALLCARWIAALNRQLYSHCLSLADLFRLFSVTKLLPFLRLFLRGGATVAPKRRKRRDR